MKSLTGIIKGAVIGAAIVGLGACATITTVGCLHHKNHMVLSMQKGNVKTNYAFGIINNDAIYCHLERFVVKEIDPGYMVFYDEDCNGSVDRYWGRIAGTSEMIALGRTDFVGTDKESAVKEQFQEFDKIFKGELDKILEVGGYMSIRKCTSCVPGPYVR